MRFDRQATNFRDKKTNKHVERVPTRTRESIGKRGKLEWLVFVGVVGIVGVVVVVVCCVCGCGCGCGCGVPSGGRGHNFRQTSL